MVCFLTGDVNDTSMALYVHSFNFFYTQLAQMLEEGALGDPNVQMAASIVSNLSAEPSSASGL